MYQKGNEIAKAKPLSEELRNLAIRYVNSITDEHPGTLIKIKSEYSYGFMDKRSGEQKKYGNQIVVKSTDFRRKVISRFLKHGYYFIGKKWIGYRGDSQLPPEDLDNEAAIGTLRALHRYDPKYKIYSFLAQNIAQSVHAALIETSGIIVIPRYIFHKAMKQIRPDEESALEKLLELKISYGGIQERRPIPIDIAGAILAAIYPSQNVSNGGLYSISDTAKNSEEAYCQEQLIALTRNALATLPRREEQVLKMIYGIDTEEHTLDEAGSIFAVTRQRIRQIQSKAERRIRTSKRYRKLSKLVD